MLNVKKISAILCLSLTFGAAWAYPEKNAQEWVKYQSQSVLDFMKNTPRGQWEPWFQKEMPEVFDFRSITASTLGKDWKLASESQKKALIEEVQKMMIRMYEGSMETLKDPSFEVKSALENQDGGAVVRLVASYMSPTEGKKKSIIKYKLRHDETQWKIVDVEMEGMSVVMSFRSSLQKLVAERGIDGLIAELKAKNQKTEARLKKIKY